MCLILLMSLWAGLILGVSMLATPAKFLAPTLTMPVALDIGRHTFRLFGQIELCWLLATIVLTILARPQWMTIAALTLVVLVLALERYWLLPDLDARVRRILAGGTVPPSAHHVIYVVLEVLKSAVLISASAVEIHHVSEAHTLSPA